MVKKHVFLPRDDAFNIYATANNITHHAQCNVHILLNINICISVQLVHLTSCRDILPILLSCVNNTVLLLGVIL